MAKGERRLGHADTISLAEKLSWLLNLLGQLEIPTGNEPMRSRVIGGPKTSAKARQAQVRGKRKASREPMGGTGISRTNTVPSQSSPQESTIKNVLTAKSETTIAPPDNEQSAMSHEGTPKAKWIKDICVAVLLAAIFAAVFAYYGQQILVEATSMWHATQSFYTPIAKTVVLLLTLLASLS